MSIEVRLFPTLQNLSLSKRENFEVVWHEGLPAMEILQDEGFDEKDADAILPVINDQQGWLTTPLQDGDCLELRINLQGG